MKYLVCIPIAILFTFISCKNESKPSRQKTTADGVVGIEEFESLLKSECQLIDVRTPEEFAEGYIPNARNINFRSADFEQEVLKLDRSKPVLVYCKSGGRSGQAYTLLKEKNFDKVYDLEGGFTAWSEANKPSSK